MMIHFTRLILLSFFALLMASCGNKSEETSSISGAEIAEAAALDNLNRYIASDSQNKAGLEVITTVDFRKLSPGELKAYAQKSAIPTLEYLYDSEGDTALIVSSLGKLARDEETFTRQLADALKKQYPEGQLTEAASDNQAVIATIDFFDKNAGANNFCQLIKNDKKDLYSVCLISPKTPVSELKKVISSLGFIAGK